MAWTVPAGLAASCRWTHERAAWLCRLPEMLQQIEHQWVLRLGEPFDHEYASCAWVAPATLGDGTSAILKIGMPHFEADHELHGLRFWNGDPTVCLLRADEQTGAMLLERCMPGTALRELPEPKQDVVISSLLRRLWRVPTAPHPFRPLSLLMERWRAETLTDVKNWPDAKLVREGLRLFEELPLTAPAAVLLSTDLHACNVLRSAREPWLAIDPKPFIGDPAYDATQHLLNCDVRMRSDPFGTIRRLADLLEIDHERVQLWMFARAAAEPRPNRGDWQNEDRLALARAIAP